MRTSLVLALFAVSMAAAAPMAHAQGNQGTAELAAARNLFAEALRDEDAKRYDAALEKYRRVQGVRDTAPIRYRIGSCHEGLGQLAQALAAYRSALDLAEKDKTQDEVARASRARIDAVWKRVPQLTLVLTGRPTNDVEVRIDDRVTPVATLKEPIAVDPGEHVITATAPNSKPFRTVVFLPERGRVSLTVPLDGSPSTSTPVTTTTPATATPEDKGLTNSTPQPPPTETASKSGNSQKVWGAVIFGTGAAAMVAGGVMLIMRSSDISTLKRECEGGCPPEKADELQSIHDRATLFGPLGGALLGGGAAVAGLGAWFFFTAKGEEKTAIVPWISPTVGGLTMSGRF